MLGLSRVLLQHSVRSALSTEEGPGRRDGIGQRADAAGWLQDRCCRAAPNCEGTLYDECAPVVTSEEQSVSESDSVAWRKRWFRSGLILDNLVCAQVPLVGDSVATEPGSRLRIAILSSDQGAANCSPGDQ
jgi:hypothetical protein